MFFASQVRWSVDAIDQLDGHLEAISLVAQRHAVGENPNILVLLPKSDDVCAGLPLRGVIEIVSDAAARHRIYLGGSVDCRADAGGGRQTWAFLIDAQGKALIETAKLSPELVNGIVTDWTCGTREPAKFATASTPFGLIGLAPGEDILFPHLVRSLVWKGAEIILNPTQELSDAHLTARNNARASRAFENIVYVATASAVDSRIGPHRMRRPPIAGLTDWTGRNVRAAADEDFVWLEFNIDQLRRKRTAIFSVQPLHLRANLYAEGYRRLAAQAAVPVAAPATKTAWGAEAKQRLANGQAGTGKGSETEYDVLLVQNVKKMIQKTSDVVAMRTENIMRALELPARTASNPNVRLVAFSEFFMTGQGGHGYRSPITLQRLAIRYPGPELELLSEFALKHKVYVAGSSFEIDDKLPGYVFNSAFILNDSGDLIHRYRKIQCADVWGSLPDTTPSTIYDRYLQVYGYDSLFPVADTSIGRLATMVCFDQAHPEVVRMLVKHGAEVIIHPSSEGHGSGRRAWDLARQTRAFENVAYVLSPLPGGEYFNPDTRHEHTNQMRGYTKLVNFDGSLQGELDTPGAAVLAGTLDLLALRRARANPHLNLALWDDPIHYAAEYAKDVGLPNNLGTGDPFENPYRGMRPLRRVLASYVERGIFVPPTVASSRTLSVPGKAQPDFDKAERSRPSPRPRTLADVEKMDGEFIQV